MGKGRGTRVGKEEETEGYGEEMGCTLSKRQMREAASRRKEHSDFKAADESTNVIIERCCPDSIPNYL